MEDLYQVIEHFLLKYTRSNTIRQLKLALKDPKLDVHDDRSIVRLLTIMEREQQRSSEREQLALTILECCPDDELRDFINATGQRAEFLSNSKKLSGVPRLDLQARNLADQVAARIYAIRCRIVHAKSPFQVVWPLEAFPAPDAIRGAWVSPRSKRHQCVDQ